MPGQQANPRDGAGPNGGLTCEDCDIRDATSVDAEGRFLCDECFTELEDDFLDELWEVLDRHAPRLGATGLERLLVDLRFDVVREFASDLERETRRRQAQARADSARRLLQIARGEDGGRFDADRRAA